MGLQEITQSHGWKNFMAKLYGIGASVVIIGALFKITHWPGATIMLVAGLGTEALIFFFSAFEPIHEEIDWTLVYPELAGLDEDSIEVENKGRNKNLPTTSSTSSGEALDKFNAMIDKAGDSNLFEKFGEGIENLNTKVSQMSDISDASIATNEYSENMKSASSAVSNLVESYNKSAEAVTYSSESLSDSFSKASEKVSSGGAEFEQAYQRLTGSMDLDFTSLQDGNSEYNEHIGKLNKNLSALNAIFELQLNEADLDKMMEDLQGSVEHSKKYHEEINSLGRKLEALNNVYGNMLSAMNVHLDK